MHLDISNPSDNVVYLKDGKRLHFVMNAGVSAGLSSYVDRIEDTDGNLVTFSQNSTRTSVLAVHDTVNRSVTVDSSVPPTFISYTDSNGTIQTIAFGYSSVHIAPTFTLPSGASAPPNLNQTLMTSITLPNQRSYTFQYNNFGELTEVTYPTGGYTRYDYAAFTAWYPKPVLLGGDFREVTAKHVCYDPAGGCTQGTEVTTTYTPTIDQNKTSNQYMNVQEPNGRLTDYQFSFGTRTTPGDPLFSPRELSRTIYDNGTALRTVTRTYNNLDTYGNTTNSSLPLTEITTLLARIIHEKWSLSVIVRMSDM